MARPYRDGSDRDKLAVRFLLADDGVPGQHAAAIAALVNALATICAWQLAADPSLPPLLSGAIRYEREPTGTEDFPDARTLAERGYGDCAPLAAYRIGELRARGGEPDAVCEVTDWLHASGKVEYHITVIRADGSREDPSRLLGMQ